MNKSYSIKIVTCIGRVFFYFLFFIFLFHEITARQGSISNLLLIDIDFLFCFCNVPPNYVCSLSGGMLFYAYLYILLACSAAVAVVENYDRCVGEVRNRQKFSRSNCTLPGISFP